VGVNRTFQIEPFPCAEMLLIIGFYWNAACRGPRHCFRNCVCVPEVVLVTLTERLCIRRGYLSHIMTEREQLAGNVVCLGNPASGTLGAEDAAHSRPSRLQTAPIACECGQQTMRARYDPHKARDVRPEAHSTGPDRLQCSWHVGYQFCGLSAQITVHAESEADARANAIDQLRMRGLRIAGAATPFPTAMVSRRPGHKLSQDC
jgi:hypothetical protein